MGILVDMQYEFLDPRLPDKGLITTWVNAALNNSDKNVELTIRIVGEEEGKELNERWRHSKGSTNVLSFPAEEILETSPKLLGEIVICAPVVEREAEQQQKSLTEHWAHMVIHGTLHLLAYDHKNNNEAKIMESLETTILKKLGFKDPYT